MLQDIEKMEFEEAMRELEEILIKMDNGEVSLKESVDLFERGSALKRHCEKILNEAQLRISKISSVEPLTVVEFETER